VKLFFDLCKNQVYCGNHHVNITAQEQNTISVTVFNIYVPSYGARLCSSVDAACDFHRVIRHYR